MVKNDFTAQNLLKSICVVRLDFHVDLSIRKIARVKFEIVTDVTPSSDNLVQFWPRLIFCSIALVVTSIANISQIMG